jgi:hypothetical protein
MSLTPGGADHHRLAAAPLLRAVQQHARLRRQSLRELVGPELFGAYGNAQATGTISLVTLERFCDEVLGWHPRMLYGEAYDQATLPPPRRALPRRAVLRAGVVLLPSGASNDRIGCARAVIELQQRSGHPQVGAAGVLPVAGVAWSGYRVWCAGYPLLRKRWSIDILRDSLRSLLQ